jgi:hypothetical protein
MDIAVNVENTWRIKILLKSLKEVKKNEQTFFFWGVGASFNKWGMFWNPLHGLFIDNSKENFKNNYFIFKSNYFISFLIIFLSLTFLLIISILQLSHSFSLSRDMDMN